jgi:hypothetical protein
MNNPGESVCGAEGSLTPIKEERKLSIDIEVVLSG